LKHKDIIPQQDELFNNLFSERLDKVDSHYIDTLFLLYSKRQNKNKNVDELCIRKIYDITAKKLQKDNLDISNIQVIVDHATDDYDEISLKLSEYLNLLENIRMEFKKQNSNYESKAKDELPHFGEEELIYTDYQANFLADEIRAKKIAICSKEYDELLASGDLQADFSSLCHAFYLIFR